MQILVMKKKITFLSSRFLFDFVYDRYFMLSLFAHKFEWNKHEISIVSKDNKNRHNRKNVHMSQPP